MLYNSFQFLWLLPLILVAYYFLPILFVPLKISKTIVANRLLLIVSYALYMQWNPAYALILLGVTAETYLFALWIGNTGAMAKEIFTDKLWNRSGTSSAVSVQVL